MPHSTVFKNPGPPMAWLILAALLLPAGVARAQSLDTRFQSLYSNFGAHSTTTVTLLSGPTTVTMGRGGTGSQWIARSGEYQFKLTIEDATGVSINSLVDRVRKLPAPYIRACKEVSDPGEDGIALYVTLGGAAGHGGKDYINLISNANSLVIAHESGHTLEQVRTQAYPDTLTKWAAAIAADNISVSSYGNTNTWEDLAEFGKVYAVCLDAGSTRLNELKGLSPTRYAQWQSILYVPEPSTLALLATTATALLTRQRRNAA